MITDNLFGKTIVLDTSVILKWFLHKGEPGREQALALRDAYLEGHTHLLAPDLLLYEVANVLRYKPDWDTSRVAQAIQSILRLKLQITSVSSGLLQRAVELAYEYELAVYDASFVALAEETQAVFVTADQKVTHQLKESPYVCSLTDVTTNN